jgi:hypothetical protein
LRFAFAPQAPALLVKLVQLRSVWSASNALAGAAQTSANPTDRQSSGANRALGLDPAITV